MGALERMRDELGRARRRGSRVLMPEAAVSPMDLNPTLEVSAAIIADCAADAAHLRVSSDARADLAARTALDRTALEQAGLDRAATDGSDLDRGMIEAATGLPPRTAHRYTA